MVGRCLSGALGHSGVERRVAHVPTAMSFEQMYLVLSQEAFSPDRKFREFPDHGMRKFEFSCRECGRDAAIYRVQTPR